MTSNYFVLSSSKEPQKFHMNGFVLYQSTLERLESHVEKGLVSSSGAAVLVALHDECDSQGFIYPHATKPTYLANKLHIHTSTAYYGFQNLIENTWVIAAGVNENGEMVYRMPFYHHIPVPQYNEEGQVTKMESINYFRVPFDVFASHAFKKLIRRRCARGIVELLKMFNSCTREIRKEVGDAPTLSLPRKMNYLKQSLRTTTKRVRAFIESISDLFEAVPHKHTSRVYTKDGQTIAAEYIYKYEFSIKSSKWFKQYASEDEREFAAQSKKFEAGLAHVLNSIKNVLNDALSKQTHFDFASVYRLDVCERARLFDDTQTRQHIYSYVSHYVVDQIERYASNGRKIRNIVGFVRKKLNEAWRYYAGTYFEPGTLSVLVTKYVQIHGEEAKIPDWLQNIYDEGNEKKPRRSYFVSQEPALEELPY
ncbi:hypothetical protein GFC29_3839 (plasmid) [Anoxybacillus sp. B7M1]|uniref:hypothetical protein n=1 Tax=Anoxybacillus sp. B7M1 TaxID=1490057 RepID=UPI0005CD7D5B|nr:hypothetical protein [Anoxybacillus sp. B7M1]ANB66117.1 hypothetical protein GFC29_3839 [Anoxybacillus sp. B7M1]